MKTLSWSTHLLERTIAEDPHNLTLLSTATLAMERSYQFEPPQFWNAAANLKNLGLAYAQIVKSSNEFAPGGSDPFLNDVVGSSVGDKSRCVPVWSGPCREKSSELTSACVPAA